MRTALMTGRRRLAVVGVTALAATALPTAGSTAAPDSPPPAATTTPSWASSGDGSGPGQRPTVRFGGEIYPASDPHLSYLPDNRGVDLDYWRAYAVRLSQARAAARVEAEPGVVLAESEPRNVQGRNDDPASAELVAGFGTGDADPTAWVSGRLAPDPVEVERLGRYRETSRGDDGSVPLARRTAIPAAHPGIVTVARIGDGPHGRSGDGKADFDFYRLRLPKGRQIEVSMRALDGNLRPYLNLYNRRGAYLAGARPHEGVAQIVAAPGPGTYYLLASDARVQPRNVNRSGSSSAARGEGRYRFSLAAARPDRDFFAVDLHAGDVLGGVVQGRVDWLSVYGPDGTKLFGSDWDPTYSYPAATPLPGGGTAVVSQVAAEDGRYTVEVTGGVDDYRARLEVYRPGQEGDAAGAVQTLFLDFDGARLNTAIFRGPGVRRLSPLSRFLDGWSLRPGQEDSLIDAVVASVGENIRRDLARNGLNPDLGVRILNSADHADPWGQPNVTRVIVGGTIRQLGLRTIGIAESIDPGNFDQEETALVLLDVLSGPSEQWGEASLNSWLRPRSDRVAFIGRALGNVVAHEAGHVLGNRHVDQYDNRPDLMDQGGNFRAMFGPGPDGVGGTDDDRDTDFGVNRLNPFEAYRGFHDTLNNTAFALTTGSAR